MKFMESKKNIFGRRQPNKLHKIFGEIPIIKQATEPSNIIWENFSINADIVEKRRKLMYIFFLIIYLIIFSVSIKIYQQDTEFEKNFNIKTQCNLITQYTTSNSLALEDAINDKKDALEGNGIGFYHCFCQNQFDLNDVIENEEDDICNEYDSMYTNFILYR